MIQIFKLTVNGLFLLQSVKKKFVLFGLLPIQSFAILKKKKISVIKN